MKRSNVQLIEQRAHPPYHGYAARMGPIRGPHEAYLLMRGLAERQPVENFWTVGVDAWGMLVAPPMLVARGQVDHVEVDLRDAFAPMLRFRPAGVFGVHNHPSGYASPSWEDRRLTHGLRGQAASMGLTFLDHVIIGFRQYYSFTEGQLWQVGRQQR